MLLTGGVRAFVQECGRRGGEKHALYRPDRPDWQSAAAGGVSSDRPVGLHGAAGKSAWRGDGHPQLLHHGADGGSGA